MLNFVLPDTFSYKNLNKFIAIAIKLFPEKLKYKNITITAESGNVPYLSWNGNINSNIGNGLYYNNFIDFQRNITVPYRLNMANVLLEDYDYDDNLGQTILNIFHDGSTILEISSIPLMEKIHKDYPNYYFMFSKQADLISEFTPEILNEILKINGIVKIGIPDKYSQNLEWLKKLKHKNKYEITINPYCSPTCKNCDVCALKEHQNQLMYSGMQFITNCSNHNNIYDMSNVITIEQIIQNLMPLGFINFVFNYDYNYNSEFLLNFYVNYFFKPEYQKDIFIEWEKFNNYSIK